MYGLFFMLLNALQLCQQYVQTLEIYRPYEDNNLCQNLFRVVATDEGMLHHYADVNRTFPMSDIITADGYPKLVYVFNNSLPGPVLHVYQNQTVRVRIYNNMMTESLSVHFHGIRQVNTPESDGIGQLTQISILPGADFLHEFVATDEGTFWYHSHMHLQTAMGLMGGFVVHPRVKPSAADDGEFVLLLNDWQHFYTSEQQYLLIESGQFYPNDLESLTKSETIDFFQSVDGSRAAEALVTSILINGRGQYIDTRNGTSGSSTTPFERLKVPSTQVNKSYRFRLINGGSVFSLKFSIDKHLLKVISSDGVPFAQPMIVDQLIIGVGERYDLLIDNFTGIDTSVNYWIRVNTMGRNNNSRWHSYAILQYAETETKPTTVPRTCSLSQPCQILNCPFIQYGPGDSDGRNTFICLTPLNISTHADHLDEELFSENIRININHTLSLTMVKGNDNRAGFESFNYIGMKYPPLKESVLSNPRRARELLPCSGRSLAEDDGEKCYHALVAQYNDVIELLVVNHDDDQHPLHLHGSYFHIVEQGLSVLNKTTGEIMSNNPKIVCDEHAVCTCQSEDRTCGTNNMRLVKDTIQLPKGGYMRIRFRAQNPGVWLFHCHTEPHLDRGMAIVFHIAEDRLSPVHSGTMATSNNHHVLAIDVECVATGYTHEDRAPCSVAIVNDRCEIIYSSLIRPTEKVVSDLYPFTGLKIKDLEQAPPLDEVLQKIYPFFGPTTIIVGQSPKNDIKWLHLQKGTHYSDVIDLSDWFKAYNPRFGNFNFSSLAHEALTLLHVNLNASNGHLATQDAKASMQLYLKYKDDEKAKEAARQLLIRTRPGVSPSKACNYKYEGVCLAGYFPKMCTCDRPSYSSD
ncbi:unnamed protein product [Adineta ricciae]|uniref:Exonuclease domain-containing protein n=2 Tax=Adineta ricciae TaxID=249248 RepID=A0A814M8S1_ADIRI|nr:unnamed protein product [Adineta ricciae]